LFLGCRSSECGWRRRDEQSGENHVTHGKPPFLKERTVAARSASRNRPFDKRQATASE
jgi:hypothetical protein